MKRKAKYNKNYDNLICETKDCRKFGKLYSHLINASVDPCDDFYEFVCGKCANSRQIPEDMMSFGTLDRADEKVQQILRIQLRQMPRECDPKSVQYANRLYMGCNDRETLEFRGIEPLVDILNRIGGWPLIGSKSVYKDEVYKPFDALALVIGLYAQSSVVEMAVMPDLKDNQKNILYFGSSPSLLLKQKLIGKKSTNFLVPIAPNLPDDDLSSDQESVDLISLIQLYIFEISKLLGAIDGNDTRQQILEMIVFSAELENIQTENQSLESEYNKMTFAKLNKLSSHQIDWLQFVNNIYTLIGSEFRFNYDDYCVVNDINYFRELPKILEKTPKRVFANFLGISIIESFKSYTIEAFRDLDFELEKALNGTEKQSELWRICLALVRNTMSFAISRKYVEQNFDLKSKTQSTELFNFIAKAFNELLHKNKVLDKYTKSRSITKLKTIIKNVGYPDWLFDDNTLDSLYNLSEDCESHNVFECIVYLLRQIVINNFDSIDKPVNFELDWPLSPDTVNGAYAPAQNSITIPAGIIYQFFGCDRPSYLNFGLLGAVVGHEITHGFDETGSKFDETGNLGSIWNKLTQKRFDRKGKCFIKQYNKFCDFGFSVNGTNTIGENTADNGGVRQAFIAYKNCNDAKGKPQRLPYVSQYTADQLFFISYASLWCDSIRPEAMKSLYEEDVHSPPKYRVNGVLANFHYFAKTFNCPIDSPMNPNLKCVLW